MVTDEACRAGDKYTFRSHVPSSERALIGAAGVQPHNVHASAAYPRPDAQWVGEGQPNRVRMNDRS